ncbi:hypothetical protein SMC92_004589 [Cronobacter dublinensis]|nr:hypothetical protein [Cronobacter dublinensis]
MKDNTVINLVSDIIPGKSIGGISLGDNVVDIIECIGDEFTIDVFSFENFGVKYFCYKINNGAISFTCNESGNIISLWCEPPYLGSFNKKLYPGITVGELKKISKKQSIIKGYLVIDNNKLIYYGMPDDIDDFNHFSDLDDDVIFNELYVGNLE